MQPKLNSEQHVPAFKGALKHKGRTEVVGDPRFVVREGDLSFSGPELPDIIDTCRIGLDLFKELERECNIVCVPVLYVVARDAEDKIMFYGITEKVNIVNIDELGEPEKTAALTEARRICETLVTYYEHKAKTGQRCLTDLMSEQYVYGTISGCPQPMWYLVDLDFFFGDPIEFLQEILAIGDVMDAFEAMCRTELPDLCQRLVALVESKTECCG